MAPSSISKQLLSTLFTLLFATPATSVYIPIVSSYDGWNTIIQPTTEANVYIIPVESTPFLVLTAPAYTLPIQIIPVHSPTGLTIIPVHLTTAVAPAPTGLTIIPVDITTAPAIVPVPTNCPAGSQKNGIGGCVPVPTTTPALQIIPVHTTTTPALQIIPVPTGLTIIPVHTTATSAIIPIPVPTACAAGFQKNGNAGCQPIPKPTSVTPAAAWYSSPALLAASAAQLPPFIIPEAGITIEACIPNLGNPTACTASLHTNSLWLSDANVQWGKLNIFDHTCALISSFPSVQLDGFMMESGATFTTSLPKTSLKVTAHVGMLANMRVAYGAYYTKASDPYALFVNGNWNYEGQWTNAAHGTDFRGQWNEAPGREGVYDQFRVPFVCY